MRQIIIVGKTAYATAPANGYDVTKVAKDTLAFFKLSDSSLISDTIDEDFSIVLGRGDNNQPIVFPEVNYKSLKVSKTIASAAKTFTASVTVPTPVVGKEYTLIVVRKGVVRHERNTWTATTRATTTTAEDVASALAKQFNASTETSDVKATTSEGKITITAVKAGIDFELVGADELQGVAVTDKTIGLAGLCDKAYIQDLASRCAAGKGFNTTYRDGDTIYPGYPESVSYDKYTLYTLSFAVPRVGGKTRDEVVTQVVYIAIPEGASAITTLDTLFGTSASITPIDETDSAPVESNPSKKPSSSSTSSGSSSNTQPKDNQDLLDD